MSTRFHQAEFISIEQEVVKYSRPVGIIGAIQRAGTPLEKMTKKVSLALFKSEYAAYPTEEDLFKVDVPPP